MRPKLSKAKKPYELTLTVEGANRARAGVAKFCGELGSFTQEPLPRYKSVAIAFDSTTMVYGVPGEVDVKNKFELVLDFNHTKYGKTKGLTPLDLQLLLFNQHVSHEITMAFVLAMSYAADVESNGVNDVHQSLFDTQLGRVIALVEKSAKILRLI